MCMLVVMYLVSMLVYNIVFSVYVGIDVMYLVCMLVLCFIVFSVYVGI